LVLISLVIGKVVVTYGYAKEEFPKGGRMSRHFQLESNMTLSGAAADKRLAMSTANQKQRG
jgi:molybdopterin-containing oxidoreductase family iron-sulfur binding subunit